MAVDDWPHLREDEREDAIRILSYSFPQWRALPQLAAATPLDRTFAVRVDGRLAAVALWRVDEVFAFTRWTPIAVLWAGATDPAFRGRELLASRQERFLERMREAGCVFSGLQTSISRWHRRNGWGPGAAVAEYVAEPPALRPSATPSGEVVGDPAPKALNDLYEQAACGRFGFLRRDPARWRALAESEWYLLRRDRVAWQDPDGTLTGHLRYSHRRVDGGIDLIVDELVTTTPTATAGLLAFLARHNNVTRVRCVVAADHPLLSMIEDPDAIEVRVRVDKMLRVVDVGGLRFEPEADASGLTVVVRDLHAPWNDGSWLAEGDRLVRVDQEGRERCQVGAPALAPVVARYLPVHAAVAGGLVDSTSPGAAARLRALVGVGPAPYCPERW